MKLNFSYILNELLTEATPDEIYNKYYSSIEFKNFVKIVNADPETINKDGKLSKIGRFSKLLIKLSLSGNLKNEDLPKATEYLGLIYKHNVPVNINKIKSLGDLFNTVKSYYASSGKDLSELFTLLDDKEYKVLFNGENWIIYQPLSEKAACYIGVGTQWCTAWGPYSTNKNYVDRSNRFSSHNNSGILYILVNKSDHKEKYQFHFETEQFMDVSDRQIYVPDFLDNNPEIKYFFFPSLREHKNPSTYEKEIGLMKWLNPKDSMKLLRQNGDNRFDDSKLINAIFNEDEEVVNELITTEHGSIEFRDGKILFSQNEGGYPLEHFISNLNYMESLSRNVSDDLYSYIDDDDYDNGDTLREIIKEYHENNKGFIVNELGGRFGDINNFMMLYGKLVESEDFKSLYRTGFINLNEDHVSDQIDRDIKKMEQFLEVDGYYGKVILPIPYFILQCVDEKKYDKIDDLSSILDNYAERYDTNEEFYGIHEMDLKYPTYKDIEDKVDDYFNDLYEKGDEDKEMCHDKSQLFDNIYMKYFKNNHTIENEEIIFTINEPFIKCEKGGVVNITYTSKKTGEKSTGDIHVDDIVPYITNHKLFEVYLSFKKNII